MNETLAVTIFLVSHSTYSVPCQDHLFHLLCLLMEASPFYFALQAVLAMNKEKQLQKQKLYYDAYVVPAFRNLIHLFQVWEQLQLS